VRCLILIAIFLALQCKTECQLDFSGGLEAGLSSSQVSGDALDGFDKFGLSAGPFVRAAWSETSSVRMSIVYINKGSRKNANPKLNDFRTYALRLNYVEVPLLYNYTYQNRFRGEAGLAIGTLISSSERDNGLELEISDPFKSYEFSLVVGANYLLTDNLFFNLRYTNSVIPVRNSPSTVNPLSFYEAGQYNSVLQFMVGYEF